MKISTEAFTVNARLDFGQIIRQAHALTSMNVSIIRDFASKNAQTFMEAIDARAIQATSYQRPKILIVMILTSVLQA